MEVINAIHYADVSINLCIMYMEYSIFYRLFFLFWG